jgi:hypothetical protein
VWVAAPFSAFVSRHSAVVKATSTRPPAQAEDWTQCDSTSRKRTADRQLFCNLLKLRFFYKEFPFKFPRDLHQFAFNIRAVGREGLALGNSCSSFVIEERVAFTGGQRDGDRCGVRPPICKPTASRGVHAHRSSERHHSLTGLLPSARFHQLLTSITINSLNI